MHDKPTIEESSYTCYWTSNGIIASLDGGTTWAVDKNGNALFNTITAIGLSFDWLNGGTIKLGGSNNKNGLLKILNASGAEIAQMDNLGLNYNDNLLIGYNNKGLTSYPVIKETYTYGEKQHLVKLRKAQYLFTMTKAEPMTLHEKHMQE
ncbi:MAG: hypothetical protein ACLRMZ_13650 [Blautia marasmi]